MALILLAVYLEHVQMSEELKAALARIACLEGEIAKRDARIAELESQYQRDVWGLNNEGDPIGGDPAGGYANDNARLRAELAALKAQEPVAWPEGGSDAVEGAALGAFDSLGQPEHDLESWCAGYAEAVYAHAAPVSEAKAQGVVMPAELDRAFITGESCDGVYRVAIQSETLKEMQAVHSWLTSLNAAPAAPAADGWIPVSERLPAVESRLDQECRAGTLSIAPLNVSAAVLVFDGEKVRSKRLDWFDGCLPLPYCITHWMPLPAAPAANSAKGVV